MSPVTPKKYFNILEAFYIVFVVHPWHNNIARATLQTLKVYFYDAGLVEGDEGLSFENLIANTDRYHGNVSLLLHQHRWQLAPAYDMLLMFYAPVAGEVVKRDGSSQRPHPNAHTLSVWPQARELAVRFWQSAASDARISDAFREVAHVNGGVVQGL